MHDDEIVGSGELPRLESVSALEPYRLEVAWRDGGHAVIDVAHYVRKFRVFGPLRDSPELFKQVRLIAYGTGVGWTEDAELAATTLASMAMEQDQYAPEWNDPFRTPELTTR